ncbi:MAG TPA: MBL fold metallo-hydrolase [Candidatus Bilamarchaeaceae archaeon]|nr:MBL fold metallo-hydrolase [Candidatus Bilamarchaeaceae archaeon]
MEVSLGGKSIGLDCGAGDVSFLSHAHGDHVSGFRKKDKIIASEETLALAGFGAERHTEKWVELLDAGHILGSRQMYAELDGESVLYTGDFRVKDGIFGKGAKAKNADRLVVECTYGDPRFRFPDPFEVYGQVGKWVKETEGSIRLIGAYNLGKAQEIIRVLNEYAGVVPVVQRDGERFNSVYGKYGIGLERAVVGTEAAEEIMKGGFVAVVPPRLANRGFARKLGGAFGKRVLCAVATGWVMSMRHNCDAAFPLSDHADFYDIVEYMDAVGPKRVDFVHGDGTHLERKLQQRLGK